MKQIITFLAIAVLAVACEKSAVTNNETKVVGAATEKVSGIVGTWKLVSFWQDVGNGTGSWITPDFDEKITFTESGGFSSSPTFPLYDRGYSRYLAKETMITFYPATSANSADDTYNYSLQGSMLTFYPRCRETCTRIYQLVN